MTRILICLLIIVVFTISPGCNAGESEPATEEPILEEVTEAPIAEETESTEAAPVNPSTGELLPMPFSAIWTPWKGDYEGMIERRVIRVLVPYGGYQFYYEDGKPKGRRLRTRAAIRDLH